MSGPTQTLYIQSQKMLASTVQFSTYDQTPPTPPRRTHPPRRAVVVREQESPVREETPNPVTRAARSLRTQQRAYAPDTDIQTTVHTHPEGHAVLGARDAGRPNWSVFHPRAPPRMRAAHRD